MNPILAAGVATILFLAMAGFQAAMALGAPLGAYVLGGRNVGTLPARLRVASGIAAGILVVMAGVVLARAGVVGWPSAAAGLVAPATWILAGYLALNTIANLASKSRIERTAFAATTAVLCALSAYVAAAGRGPLAPGS